MQWGNSTTSAGEQSWCNRVFAGFLPSSTRSTAGDGGDMYVTLQEAELMSCLGCTSLACGVDHPPST
jgi:hypothetical protein